MTIAGQGHAVCRWTGAWRKRVAVAIGFGLVVSVAACSKNAGSPVSPSGGEPASLASHSASARFYKAAISPTSAAAGGVLTYTVRLTNCDAAGCSDTEHSGATQTIKSATIQVPAGFTVDPASLSVAVSTGTNWGAPVLVGNSIQVTKGAGGQNLAPGQWVEVSFEVTASCTGGDYSWTTAAFNGDDFATPYVLAGAQPSVTVTGSCEEECPAAPSIAAHYLQTIGVSPGSSEGRSIVSDVAQHMGPETEFDGIDPCEDGYAEAVRAFVDVLLGQLSL